MRKSAVTARTLLRLSTFCAGIDLDALHARVFAADDADGAAGDTVMPGEELDERVVRRTLDGWRGDADDQRAPALAGEFRFAGAGNDANGEDHRPGRKGRSDGKEGRTARGGSRFRPCARSFPPVLPVRPPSNPSPSSKAPCPRARGHPARGRTRACCGASGWWLRSCSRLLSA